VTLPGEVAAMVALDELVLHGWDLALGTGQQFECDPASTEVCFEFTSMASVPGEEASREGLFVGRSSTSRPTRPCSTAPSASVRV
jgi:hypothetical protein